METDAQHTEPSTAAPAKKKKKPLKVLKVILPLAVGFYFIPCWTALFLLLGWMDVKRHTVLDRQMLQRYFAGNGLLTWMLSPINHMLDFFCTGNRYVYQLDDLPETTRTEVQELITFFDSEKERIAAHIGAKMGDKKRGMLFFQWYGRQVSDEIPELAKKYKNIKTIGISVFNSKQSTSRHYGPLRVTLRVLYNFTPVRNNESYIQVGHRKYYWKDNPLFIFDDTLIHQSVNASDDLRYCAFIDIMRPNWCPPVLKLWVMIVRAFMKSVNGIFYKNWDFLK